MGSTSNVALQRESIGVAVPQASAHMSVTSVTYIGGTNVQNHATVALDIEGARRVFEDHAEHALDAAFKALRPITEDVERVDYRVKEVRDHGDATGIAHVTMVLRRGDVVKKASAEDPDTIIASVKAYVAALCELNR